LKSRRASVTLAAPHTKKSAISRLENHAKDVRLSTVARVARALGKAVRIELVEAS